MWSVSETIMFLLATFPIFATTIYLLKTTTRDIVVKLVLASMLAFSVIVMKTIISAQLFTAYVALVIMFIIAVLAK